jgi:FKBP12-rapamycin complex-associated protein
LYILAFIAIGQVAIQVKSNMSPYLDATLTCIKEALMVKGLVFY